MVLFTKQLDNYTITIILHSDELYISIVNVNTNSMYQKNIKSNEYNKYLYTSIQQNTLKIIENMNKSIQIIVYDASGIEHIINIQEKVEKQDNLGTIDLCNSYDCGC